MPKWVGFDMDECIGSVMPLYAFVTMMPAAQTMMKECLCVSENMMRTWLIRPAIYKALEHLYKAHRSGAIYGAFIFSNNGSEELVHFLGDYLNYWMARRFSDPRRPIIFKMAVSRSSPLRTPGSLDKSYSEVQRALAGKGLPLCSSQRDLLFFDDMVHILTGEIKDYVQVRPYYNLCPMDNVIGALSACEMIAGPAKWAAIVSRARAFEKTDRSREYVSTPPTFEENIMDTKMFNAAFRRFLGVSGGAKSRRRKGDPRKNTRKLK